MRLKALSLLALVLALTVLLAACGGSTTTNPTSSQSDGLLGDPQPNSGTLDLPIASMELLPGGTGTFRYRESPEAAWIEFSLTRDGTSFDIDTGTPNINHGTAPDGKSMEIARGMPGQIGFQVLFTVNVLSDGTLIAIFTQGELEVTSGDVPQMPALLSDS
jgi:hypothetical protein